ncbi:MAG TPA: amidohydrolase family protein [bacterium]|nr:amidohydrolase family protein [bacterium]
MAVYRCGWLLGASGALQKDWRLVAEHGRIHTLEPWSPTAEAYVDWSPYVVVPGFIDCHDHLGIEMGDEEAQAKEDPVTMTIKAVANARALLAAGVTTLRDVGEKDHYDVVWRRAVRAGTMMGPTLYISGQFIMRTGGHGWYMGYQADGPEEIRRAVRTQVRAGVDWVKGMITGGVSTAGLSPAAPEYSREEVHALVHEAHLRGHRVAVHAHGGDAVDWALEAGVDTVEHGVFLTDRQLEAMASRGTYLVATYGIIQQAATSPAVPDHYRTKSVEAIRQYAETLSMARAHGVLVAAGGDGWHGDPHSEAAGLVGAGYTPTEALAALTTNAARLLGLEREVGSLAVGATADLVALRGDPTADIAAIRQVAGVAQGGRLVSQR